MRGSVDFDDVVEQVPQYQEEQRKFGMNVREDAEPYGVEDPQRV